VPIAVNYLTDERRDMKSVTLLLSIACMSIQLLADV
jgi:hypothetical protein